MMNHRIVAEKINLLAEELKADYLDKKQEEEQWDAWYAAARDKNTPPKVLDSLMDKGSSYLQKEVMKNPNTPASAFEKVRYQAFDMRLAAALHPNTPSSVLDKLDGNREIRQAVASHSHTSQKKLDELSKSPDSFVRNSVARNPHTSEATLKRLMDDKIWLVRTSAEENLSSRK